MSSHMALFHPFFKAELYSIIYIYICLCMYTYISFVHSFIDGLLCYLLVLAVINSAAMNVGVQVFFFKYGFLHMPRRGLLDDIYPISHMLKRYWSINLPSHIMTVLLREGFYFICFVTSQ